GDIAPRCTLGHIDCGKPILVAGDLNCSHVSWAGPSGTTSDRADQVLEWAAANNLTCINGNQGHPTYRGSLGRTFIDAAFASESLANRCSAATVPDLSGVVPSDHECLMWAFAPPGNSTRTQANRTARRAKDTDWKQFHDRLRHFRSRGPVTSPQDLQSRTARLINILRNAVKSSTRATHPGSRKDHKKD
ncbi:hypothetical protein FOZ62_019562, partial [Perkinsus olseni]